MLTLLPLSYRELHGAKDRISFDDYLYRGGYPRLYNVDIPEAVYYSNYVTTYLDRDASGLINASSLNRFNFFANSRDQRWAADQRCLDGV